MIKKIIIWIIILIITWLSIKFYLIDSQKSNYIDFDKNKHDLRNFSKIKTINEKWIIIDNWNSINYKNLILSKINQETNKYDYINIKDCSLYEWKEINYIYYNNSWKYEINCSYMKRHEHEHE